MSKRKNKKQKSSNRFLDVIPKPLLVILVGFVLVAGSLFALWKSGQPVSEGVPVEVKDQPKLKVDREILDFGDVKVGKIVRASFTLTNIGGETLRITDEPYITVLEGC